MSVDSVAAVSAAMQTGATNLPGTNPVGFGAWFERELGQVNSALLQADRQLAALATGETQSLHQVMIAVEEARLATQLLVQIRNRLVEGYQEVMRMQI
jgi:flagellar hook-basal body complex protein FliE